MFEIQSDEYFDIKELHNLLNNFEKVFPILKRNIEKFEIEDIQYKCYLAWVGGIYFHKKDRNFFEKFVMDVLFKNIFSSLNIDALSIKALMFIYFGLGGISSINYFNNKKDFFKEYFPLLSKGAVLIDNLKFDKFKDGFKYWELSTISKYIKPHNRKLFSNISNKNDKDIMETGYFTIN
jgi:hypothetical protein